MAKALATVKVMSGHKTLLDWYVITLDSEKNFSQVLEAISLASHHGLTSSRFKEPISMNDFKDGRAFLVKGIENIKDRIEVSWGLNVIECVHSFGHINNILYMMTPKTETKPMQNAFDLLKEGQKNLSAETLQYPEKLGSEANTRGDIKLYN